MFKKGKLELIEEIELLNKKIEQLQLDKMLLSSKSDCLNKVNLKEIEIERLTNELQREKEKNKHLKKRVKEQKEIIKQLDYMILEIKKA